MSRHLEKTPQQIEKRGHLNGLSFDALCEMSRARGFVVFDGTSPIPHRQIFQDIASLIVPYAQKGIMLPKTPEDIQGGYDHGNAIILVHQNYVADGTRARLLSHAACYPLVNLPFPAGKIVVGEIGGVIKGSDLDFPINGGYTVGETTIALLQKKVRGEILKNSTGDALAHLIATVKYDNVENAFWEVSMDREPFENIALLTHATCVCSGVAEKHNADSPQHFCHYRMTSFHSHGNINEDGICRLVIHNKDQAIESEHVLRALFSQQMGFPYPQDGKMDGSKSKLIYEFYERIGAEIL